MTNLTDIIKLYETKFSELKSTTKPSFNQVVSVLLTRDQIQYFIEWDDVQHNQNLEDIQKLSEYDHLLKTQIKKLRTDWESEDKKEYLNRKNKLEQEIDIYTRFPDSWWWQSFRLDISRWDRFDWITNLGTIACSIVATSIFSQTVKTVLAIGGLNFWGTVVTLSQAALGVIFAGGTLTDRGKEKVEKSLDKIKVPRHLQTQIIFLAAIILSFVFCGTNKVGFYAIQTYYTNQAKEDFNNGNFSKAVQKYKKLQILKSDDLEISANLGKAYEFNLQLEEALKEYKKGIGEKDPQSLIGISRTIIFQELLKLQDGSVFLGKIPTGQISIVQIYLDEAQEKILDKKYQDIKKIIAEINQDRLSSEVKESIRIVEEKYKNKSISIEDFAIVVLEIEKINNKIKSEKIRSFLEQLYSKEDQDIKLLLQAKFVEVILLNWSKRDFDNFGVTVAYSGKRDQPIDYRYKSVNISEEEKFLIDKYKQLPEWKKLNCSVKIDNYLNLVDGYLKNTKFPKLQNIENERLRSLGRYPENSQSQELENMENAESPKLEDIEKESREIRQDCLKKHDDSQKIILSDYESQLMVEIFIFFDGKAKHE